MRVVHLADRLMERQLGWEASQVAVAGLQRLGITTHVGASVVGVTTRRGRLESVRFGDGLEAAADLFVMCTGTVPETMLARRAGLTCRPGRRRRRRPAPAPTTRTCTPSATAPSRRPAPPDSSRRAGSRRRRLVARLTDQDPDRGPSTATHDVVRVKATGMSMVSMGVCGDFDRDDPRYRVLSLKDPERGRYAEVVVSSGHLVGATCIGDADVAATLSALYTRSLPVPDDPALLLVRALAGGGTASVAKRPEELADEDRVCTCNSVSAGRIREAVRGGCASVADVAAATRASTGCGDCAGVVGALVAARPPPRADRTEPW